MLYSKNKYQWYRSCDWGGITDNIPRIIPDGLTASLELKLLKIQKYSDISRKIKNN